ncbi:AP-3 complex subunit delta [Ophidiomyces ophidiicola]|nr:AP-3 complex subunit delta [Ophidiomyces ophidiicola]
MDKKATALLKLIYLEMFGYDMSWAAFHVLEVMSSQKYLEKRVGYLGAAQSFHSDTEILMLATNLLKKDMISPLVPTMTLPLLVLPHIISPSLALSLLSDLTPRLSHSHSSVRKKAVVNLYRLSLVYPEAFHLAWPRIQERLMDEQEDDSVTASVINVVCELGWRRPRDFLQLAPRLFGLLVDGGNNWMAIKVLKLFTFLTPLESRLVHKLIRPLTLIIKTTCAMSLLYESINGVIQGGILENSESEGESIAHLCVEKLSGMLFLEGDPNLKYVSLLAFNRIILSYPMLVSQQQTLIMDCLGDKDISIRLQALELISGMITTDNLQYVVGQLITQLQKSPIEEVVAKDFLMETKPVGDAYDQHIPESLQVNKKQSHTIFLPNDYQVEVLNRILDMCSRSTYSFILDFEWYLDVLVQLVQLVPASSSPLRVSTVASVESEDRLERCASRIGFELRNVAVRVKGIRSEAVHAAESLISMDNREILFPANSQSRVPVLEYASWIVGEFSEYLASPEQSLSSLIYPANVKLSPKVISSYIQAIPKVLVHLARNNQCSAKQTEIQLTKILDFLKNLSLHSDLDIQERATGFLELFNLTAEALSQETAGKPPLLLSSAIPTLFSGLDLNPVAMSAQKKVPVPEDLKLYTPINPRLAFLLEQSQDITLDSLSKTEINVFYYEMPPVGDNSFPKEILSPYPAASSPSYQNIKDDTLTLDAITKRRAERREQNKEEPFYIGIDSPGNSSTPVPATNSEDLDLDSIPIIDLAINKRNIPGTTKLRPNNSDNQRRFEIIGDETIDVMNGQSTSCPPLKAGTKTGKPMVDINFGSVNGPLPKGRNPSVLTEEHEMAKAIEKVEQFRLKMQRTTEQIHVVDDVPPEGALVKRKKKKRVKLTNVDAGHANEISIKVNKET